MIFGVFALFFACVKKTGAEVQDDSEKWGDQSASAVILEEVALTTGNTSSVSENNPVGYYNYIRDYEELTNTTNGRDPYPNGNFSDWVDLCWLWGQYLGNVPKANIIADTPDEFAQLFGVQVSNQNWRDYCKNLDDATTKGDTFKQTQSRKYVAKLKSVRLVPEHHLSARYAQMWLDRNPNSGVKSTFYFNGASLTYGTQEYDNDLKLIEPIEKNGANGGTGLKLKNVRASTSSSTGSILPVVNGQISTGVPRGLKSSATSGFLETVCLFDEIGCHKFTSKPKFVEVVVKYKPEKKGNLTDKATIEIMLHGSQNGVRLPFKSAEMVPPYGITVGSNALAYVRLVITETLEDKTTIKVPIYYKHQEVQPAYLLSNISAGFEYQPIEGSVLEVHSIKFEY